jgi:hypothetical protein
MGTCNWNLPILSVRTIIIKLKRNYDQPHHVYLLAYAVTANMENENWEFGTV